MIFLVTPRRYKGKARPQREVETAEPVRGDVVVVQETSEVLGRYTNIARFHLTGKDESQPLPSLNDVTLSHMGPRGFVLTGVEMIDGVAYSQSWYCRATN